MKIAPHRFVLFLFAAALLVVDCFATEQRKFEATVAATRRALQQGKIHEALEYHEAKAREAEIAASISPAPQQYWQAAFVAYMEASRAAKLSGQVQKMLSYSEKALETARKTGKPVPEIRAINGMIYAHTYIKNFAKVGPLIENGMTLVQSLPAQNSRRFYFEGAFYGHIGLAHARLREYDGAIEALSRSVHSYEKFLASIPDDSNRRENGWGSLLLHLTWLGNVYLRADKLQEAQYETDRAFRLIENWGFGYSFEGDLHRNRGEIYLRQNRLSDARRSFATALALAEGQADANRTTLASIQIGNALILSGQPSEAVGYFKKAIHQIESARSLLHAEDNRRSLFEGGLEAYVSLIKTLVVANKGEEAFNYSERARSRAFLDLLGSRVGLSRSKTDLQEKENTLKERFAEFGARLAAQGVETTPVAGSVARVWGRLQIEYEALVERTRQERKEQAVLMNVEPLKLREIQELLEPGQTLMQYFVAPEKTFLWVVEKDRSNALTVSISQRDLAQKIDEMRKSIAELNPLRDYQSLARNLHDLLVRPALPHVKGKELIIVPHGVLHYLPFQALYSPQGTYLIENYSVSYLSSASLLQFTRAKRRAVGQKMLAIGNPSFAGSKVSLPMSELEAAEIRRLYPKSAVLAKGDATEEKVKTLSPTHDVLHFATHAELNKDDPLSSAVLLAKGGSEDGRLEVREIFGMDLKANLVVLSGCETGLGKLSTGDELVGLTRAFIYAGTPSVVASLWKVDDSSTAQLMASFYKNLKTMSKVEALRHAQLNLIRGNVNSDLLARRGIGGVGKLGETPSSVLPASRSIPLSHPYFWAPFILVGDGK